MNAFLYLTVLVAFFSCKSSDKWASLDNSGQMIDYKEVAPAVNLQFAGGVRCSGTVVGTSAVMTAAHCLANVNSQETQVTVLYRESEKEPFISRVFVSEDLTSKTDLESVVEAALSYFSKTSSKHAGFSANEYPLNKSFGGRDIALIEFDRSVFHPTVPISIARENPSDRAMLQTIGFGVSRNFQHGTGRKSLAFIKSPFFCDGYYLSFSKNGSSDFITNGDSGSPLVIVDGNKSWTDKGSNPRLIGVASSGFFGLSDGKWVAVPPTKRGGETDFKKIETYVSIFTSLHSKSSQKIVERAVTQGVKLHTLTVPNQMKVAEPSCKTLPWGSFF